MWEGRRLTWRVLAPNYQPKTASVVLPSSSRGRRGGYPLRGGRNDDEAPSPLKVGDDDYMQHELRKPPSSNVLQLKLIPFKPESYTPRNGLENMNTQTDLEHPKLPPTAHLCARLPNDGR